MAASPICNPADTHPRQRCPGGSHAYSRDTHERPYDITETAETGSRLPIEEIRQRSGVDVKVPLLNGARRPYVNFDNAATAPVLWDVMETIDLFMPWYSSIHRGKGFKSELSSQAYDQAREIVGRFFGADPADQVVIFGKNSTEALNKAARRIGLTRRRGAGLADGASPNDLPWREQAQTVHIGLAPDGSLDMADVQRKFAEHAGRARPGDQRRSPTSPASSTRFTS